VSPVEDEKDPSDSESIARAIGLFDRLRELTGSDLDVPDPGTAQLSFVLAGLVELAPDDKLQLLRDVSERSRMSRVCELLERALLTTQRVREAAERAVTNGRVHVE
jgi:hypothetical protein